MFKIFKLLQPGLYSTYNWGSDDLDSSLVYRAVGSSRIEQAIEVLCTGEGNDGLWGWLQEKGAHPVEEKCRYGGPHCFLFLIGGKCCHVVGMLSSSHTYKGAQLGIWKGTCRWLCVLGGKGRRDEFMNAADYDNTGKGNTESLQCQTIFTVQ